MAYTKITIKVLLTLCVLLVGLASWLYMSGYRLSVVQTNSMAPRIPRGSLIVARPIQRLDPGNVAIYTNDLGQSIIHRLLYVSADGQYVFKGDANTLVDAPVNKHQIVGGQIWSIPWVGYVALFMKSWTGIVLCIYIPAILIMAYEINKLAFQLSAAHDKSFRRSEQTLKS